VINNYNGIRALCQMMKFKGLISKEEYEKCINELNASWDEEAAKVINETLKRVLDK
jgi:hypothetical protein